MARLSKTHHFKIFQDSGIPTPPGDENDPFDDTARRPQGSAGVEGHEYTSEHDAKDASRDDPSDEDADKDDDEDEPLPRESLGSISSFPESTAPRNDADLASSPPSPQKFFTAQVIRPSFRRTESVRRMQMTSPRQSILSYQRSSTPGTPRSEYGRGSPRDRRRGRKITEEVGSLSEEEDVNEVGKEHPLVLLHVTLLPISLPWSMQCMRELLTKQTVEDLLLLRSKMSETVAQRGILIPHPREEYEMLEERLLEALELKEERLTKCGHFRGRISESSRTSSGAGSDSGLGSSASSSDSDDGEFCATCEHHIHCKASKKQKWSMKVFAANGLMKASAWAAAWDGMESVDVEVLPWIGEDERRRLDERREEEAREERRVPREEEMRVEEGTVRCIVLRDEVETREDSVQDVDMEREPVTESGIARMAVDEWRKIPPQSTESKGTPPNNDLPPIYRASQVPLSVLLRNYIYLLAQDRRNVAIFFLGMLALVFALKPEYTERDMTLAGHGYQLRDTPLLADQDLVMQGVRGAEQRSPHMPEGEDGQVDELASRGDAAERIQFEAAGQVPQSSAYEFSVLQSAKEAVSVMMPADDEEMVLELHEHAPPPELESSKNYLERNEAAALDVKAEEMIG